MLVGLKAESEAMEVKKDQQDGEDIDALVSNSAPTMILPEGKNFKDWFKELE